MNLFQRKFSLFLLFFFIGSSVMAQKPVTLEQTLDYLNGKFAGACSVKVANGSLVLTFYKNGKEYREDKMLDPGALDIQNMTYTPEESQFIIKCKDEEGECVDRRVVAPKTRDQYKRTNIIYSGNQASIDGIYNAFNHLINLLTDLKYESSDPFE